MDKQNVCEKCYHRDFCAGSGTDTDLECDGFISGEEVEKALILQEKEDKRSRREKWDDYQAEQLEAEREKNKGYEQLAKVHSAYISILLKKLGATDSNTAISLTQAEVKEALEKYEARATIDNTAMTYKLYCAAIE